MIDRMTCEHAHTVLREWVRENEDIRSASVLPNAQGALAVSLVVRNSLKSHRISDNLREILDLPMTISMVRH